MGVVTEEAGSFRRVRRWRTVSEKRRIAELTFELSASVVLVARAHGVNANQVFKWRRVLKRGELSELAAASTALLPVMLSAPCELANGTGEDDVKSRVVGIGIAAGNREHALRQQLAQGVIDLADLPLVSQASGQSFDQSIAAVRSLQQDGSAIGTAILLIKLQHGGLGKNLWEQQTLCRAIVKHAGAFLLASNTVSTTCF